MLFTEFQSPTRENPFVDDRYEVLVRLSPDAIYVFQDGRIKFANPAGVRLLGAATQEEIAGLNMAEFMHPDFVQKAHARMAQMISSGRSSEPSQYKFLRRDSSV